jgi:glycosyltransferase involved in cell wall biosynthesis
VELNELMNIMLTIHHNLDPNAGAPGVTWKLGQEFQKLGHHVDYYSFDNLPPQLPEIVKSIVFPEFVANHLTTMTKAKPIDVVDASSGDAWVWAKLRRNSGDRPLLVTRSHGLEHVMHLEILAEARQGNLDLSWKYPLYHGGLRLWEVAQSFRTCDLALLLNQYDADYAMHQLGVDSDRVQIVANGIPQRFLNLPFEPTPSDSQHGGSPLAPETTTAPQERLCQGNGALRIAQVGSYIPRKGIGYGVPALNQILRQHPQVIMSFLGTGCPESQVHADFDPVVRDRVKVAPHYDHELLPSLLQGHQIKLFPTLSEGFSLALPEAMACGLVPVTTATPGPMEIVQDGHNGLLVPPRDPQAIVQALERLLGDRVYLEKLRRKAYETAQNYSWQQIAATTLSLYERAKHLKETRQL